MSSDDAKIRDLLRQEPGPPAAAARLWNRVEVSIEGIELRENASPDGATGPWARTRTRAGSPSAGSRVSRKLSVAVVAAVLLISWSLWSWAHRVGERPSTAEDVAAVLLRPADIAELRAGEWAQWERRLRDLEQRIDAEFEVEGADSWWLGSVERAERNLERCRQAHRSNPLNRQVWEALVESAEVKVEVMEQTLRSGRMGEP